MLALALIDLGVSMEYKPFGRSLVAFQLAALRDTDLAARFMWPLLYHDANPEAEHNTRREAPGLPDAKDVYRHVRVSEEVGAKGISKWLGKFWEGLVAEAKEPRLHSDNPPIPGD